MPNVLCGVFPDDHVDLQVSQISFVHLDVDAYQSTRDVIKWCLPRLTDKAILVFDDYGFSGCEGVTQCVHDFMGKYPKKFLLIYNLNGHGSAC